MASDRQDSYVNLWTATLMTGRRDSTILGWRARGLFSEREMFQAPQVRGRGREWCISRSALERIHRQMGGVSWYPERAEALSPQALALIEQLQAERDRYKALLDYGGTVPDARPILLDGAVLPAYPPILPDDRPPERIRADRPPSLLGRLPALPAGVFTAASVIADHGLASKVWRHDPLLPPSCPGGPWRGHRNAVKVAWGPAERRLFGERFGHRTHWRDCKRPGCEACAARAELLQLAQIGSPIEGEG